MTGTCRFSYVQARIQARYGDLPGEDDWQRLSGARTLGIFLEEAREGALRSWVKGFSALSDAHDLDQGLRAIWSDGVDEVALWMPQPWRAALCWLQWLPLLPVLAHVARRNSLPPWADRDGALRPLRGADGAIGLFDSGALAAATAGAGAGALVVPPEGLAAAWRAEWRRLWPACDRRFLINLERLAALVLRHAEAFAQAGSHAAWPLRQELRERLRVDFHRLPLQPAAAFAFLALVALDLERLRAALMERALFSLTDAA